MIIDLFTHCKLQLHIKLFQYTLALLRVLGTWILFDNVKNDK